MYLEQSQSSSDKPIAKFCLNSMEAAAVQHHSQPLAGNRVPFKDRVPGNIQLKRCKCCDLHLFNETAQVRL